ncbi:MAG: class I SAM-dependent methyltransferase [Chthonomonadales bacterium]
MNSEEYERMYRLEDTYWWFVGRHNLVLTLLRNAYPAHGRLAILDVGCGTGAMSQKLASFGTVVSADFSPLALAFSRRRGITRLVASDAVRLPFRDACFDVVIAMDLLEHVEDDQAALCEIRRVLKPGGKLISTVPAYQSLWSGHDVALMHFRRYVAAGLRQRVTAAHLRIERLSYAMTLLFPIVWIVRKLWPGRNNPKASLIPVPGFINRMLVSLLAGENRIIKYVDLPWGVTVLCVAVRP